MFPGSYTMAYRDMRLTDLVKMAGGVAPDAYIKGARIMRVPTEAERTRMEAAFKMQQEQLRQQLMQLAVNSNNNSIMQNSNETLQKQLEKFQVPNTYPVGIELDKALKDPKSDANIILRAGDRLLIPSYTATVKINGAVMYPNTVSYQRGESVRHYLDAAGGFAQNARKSGVYIIYMNGMVGKVSRGAKVEPGCEIVVPSKLTRKMSMAETMSLGSSTTLRSHQDLMRTLLLRSANGGSHPHHNDEGRRRNTTNASSIINIHYHAKSRSFRRPSHLAKAQRPLWFQPTTFF